MRSSSDQSSTHTVVPLWQQGLPARIVVAEDDEALRELVMSRLLDDGHEVYGASCASELLHLLADGGATVPPLDGADLIVLDQQLPGMSGLEIIRRLRVARSRIPLLLMSAFPTNELKREANKMGVPLLAKPFSLSELSNAALILMLTGVPRRDDELPISSV